MGAGADLRHLIAERRPLRLPGTHDAISALVAVDCGFPAIYLGGQALAASTFGLPDHSIATPVEFAEEARRIREAVDVPILCDADEGGSNPLAIQRVVRLFERAGIAGAHIEDHEPGKHLHDPSGRLFSTADMVKRVEAAVDARKSADFVVIARCDTLLVGRSLGEAVERGLAYAEAGADLIFYTRLPIGETAAVERLVGRPLVGVIFDRIARDQLESSGLSVALYPRQALLAAIAAIRRVYEGVQSDSLGAQPLASVDELLRLTHSPKFVELARRYGMLPDGAGHFA